MAEQHQSNAGAPLSLRIVTPGGVAAQVACDSVTLPAADGKDGRGGGSIGIRRGHVRAMIALAHGTVCARLAGAVVYLATVESGLAAVKDDVISIVTDSVKTGDDTEPRTEVR